MNKTSKKVTKDLKRQERGKKSHETYMKRLKEKMLEDNQMPSPSISPSTSDLTPSTPSMPSHTTRSNNTYVYGVGILAVFAIGAPVFFTYSQAKNKKQDNDRSTAQHEHMF